MSKRLIINCDDFGQSPAMNQAIMHLLEERKVSSATIMAPAPAFTEAAEWCRKHKVANVGLHLTLTSEFDAIRWKSLTGHPSLHDEEGYMPRTVAEFEQRADTKAVVKEMEAQYELVRKYEFPISHVDNHMGSLYGVATGRSHIPQVLWKCSRWGLPFRIFRKIDPDDSLLSSLSGVEKAVAQASALADTLGVTIPDYLLSHPFAKIEGETYELFKQSFLERMYRLSEGISETYIHPGVDDSDMLANVPNWEKRVWEYRLMLDEDLQYVIRDAGVILTDYHYIREHAKKPRIPAVWNLVRALITK